MVEPFNKQLREDNTSNKLATDKTVPNHHSLKRTRIQDPAISEQIRINYSQSFLALESGEA
jgi:hypothetical protein